MPSFSFKPDRPHCHQANDFIAPKTYRSASSRSYTCNCSERGGNTVYNWNSRGYDPYGPHPAYRKPGLPQSSSPGKEYGRQEKLQGTKLNGTQELCSKFKGKEKVTPEKVYEGRNVEHLAANLGEQVPSVARGLATARPYTSHPGFDGDTLPISETSSISTPQASIDADPYVPEVELVSVNSNLALPCEFAAFHGCDQSFGLYAVDNWIEHIISHHLEGYLPAECVCWFCDEFVFRSRNDSDRWMNFERRMRHISNHITEDGYTVHDIRPDFYMLDHIYKHNLIDTTVYTASRRYTEVPEPRELRSFDFISPKARRQDQISKIVAIEQAKEDRIRRRRVTNRKKSVRERDCNKEVRATEPLNSSSASEACSRLKPQDLNSYEARRKADINIHAEADESSVTISTAVITRFSDQAAPTANNKVEHSTSRYNEHADSLRSKRRVLSAPNESLLAPPYESQIRRSGPLELVDAPAYSTYKKPRILYGHPIDRKQGKRCGQPLYIDIHPTERQLAIDYAQAASGSTSSITVSGTSTNKTSLTQASSWPYSSSSQSATDITNTAGPTLSQVQPSSTFTPPVLPQGTKKYLLLCVNTGRFEIKLEHIDLTNIALDVAMFSLIREKYEEMRGPRMKRIFTVPKTVEFIKFELVRRSSTGECVGNYEKNSIPGKIEVAKKEYTFSPCPPRIGTMPIHPHVFIHSFLNPGDHLGELALLQLPKKVGRKLKCVKQPSDPFDVPYGWGVYIVEGLNTFLVSQLLLGVVAIMTLIVLLWSSLKRDIQGGTGIGQYGLAAMGTIFAICALSWEPLRGMAR
ncbi:hypothetical protein F5Y10DRAFT_266299 [Nemania abortiva]|nr:hypothetical protein F5Y10DRAFT_266299 [Nemania abortiva]